jgi:hypothetical protein
MPAATFQNLGFELAGTEPGLAAGWTLAHLASVEEIAGYGTPEAPEESFERGWTNDTFHFGLGPTAVEPALFDDGPESVEDFEEGWSQNETFIDELTSAAAADYDPGAANSPLEDFDGLWAGNSGFLFAFAPVDLAGVPTEAFESGWRSNGTFVFAFAPANLSTPLVESFEGTWPTVMKTV